MRFLSDENIPSKLTRFIASLNHDIIAIPASTPDLQIIEKSNKETRLILTLDRDFEILAMSFSFDAVLFRIDPPYADSLIIEVCESNRKLYLSSPRKRGSNLSSVDSRFRGNDKERDIPIASAKVNKAFQKLCKETKIESIKGLNLLTESGLIRVS